MRRLELIEGIYQIQQALELSKIEKIAEGVAIRARAERSIPKTDLLALLLESIKSYVILAQDFNPAARKIAEVFNLTALEDPSVWASFLSDSQGVDDTLPTIRGRIRFVNTYLPKLLELIETESIKLRNDVDNTHKGTSILTVIIPEDKKHFSSPERLVAVLQSVQIFYEVCAVTLQMRPHGLSVVTCDSGSDKSFDFLGVSEIIGCVKELIFGIWDRVVYFREHKMAARIELVKEALPVVEQLAELRQNGILSPEEAEHLRRKLLIGVDSFLKAGATIPEITERAYQNPRQLMAPEPLLLSAPVTDVVIEGEVTESNTKPNNEQESSQDESKDLNPNNLTPEEVTQLQNLLSKLRQAEKADGSESKKAEDPQSETTFEDLEL